MNLSRTVDHKGSKVLKVALSAAVAVAFAPVAAVPAFAVQSAGSADAGVSALGVNKDGTISYDGELKEDAAKPAKVTLWGAGKYELLRFMPSTSGTYCFSSTGTRADVAAELYDTVSSGSGVALGTKLAHIDGGVPQIEVSIERINEENLGSIFYFFEFACGVSAYLLGINPFNQPGVEAYKKNMFALLHKPGYEAQTEAILKRLNQ